MRWLLSRSGRSRYLDKPNYLSYTLVSLACKTSPISSCPDPLCSSPQPRGPKARRYLANSASLAGLIMPRYETPTHQLLSISSPSA